MTEYTAGDFATAQFARNPARLSATRDSGDPDLPWRTEAGYPHWRGSAVVARVLRSLGRR